LGAGITSCYSQQLPNIGDEWKDDINYDKKIIIPPPYDMIPSVDLKIKDVLFHIGLLGNTVVFISTYDSSFVVGKKQYLNKPFSMFKYCGSFNGVRGWLYYLPIEDGWFLGFPANKPIEDTTKSICVFKYKYINKNNLR